MLPKITRYNDYMTIRVVPQVNNAGASTLALDGFPPMPIVRNDGTPLVKLDMLANVPVILIFWQGKWFIPYFVRSQLPVILSANLDIYVDWNLGSDVANDGTLASPFKNIQRGVDAAFSYPPSQYFITVHVADSQNYVGFSTPSKPGPPLYIRGNAANPAAVLVTGQNNHGVTVVGTGNNMTVFGVSSQTTANAAGPGACFVASSMANLTTIGCRSGYCPGAAFEAFQGNIAIGQHSFFGNCGEMYWSALNGLISWYDGVSQTIEKPINVGYCALATQGGAISVPPSRLSFPGYGWVAGTKYLAHMNGTIGTSAGGPDFFPGNIAGSLSMGGQYL